MNVRKLATFVAVFTLSAGSYLWGTYNAPDRAVSDFNNGFSDSKRDDCEQGFLSACAWLEANR